MKWDHTLPKINQLSLHSPQKYIFNSSQENILLIAAYSLISIDLTPGQLSVYLILAHIAYFCSFLAEFISFLADFISFLADFSSFLADFGSFLAHFPV